MARQHELTQWILDNQGILDLRVRELTWIRPVFPGFTDLSVTITLAGASLRGRGTDHEEDRALGKAVCEALERFVCERLGIPSTGVAGHFDEREAKENAKLEWIERVGLFLHVGEKSSLHALFSEVQSIVVGGKPTKARRHEFQIKAPAGYFSALCLMEGVSTSSGFGGVLGLGCAATLDQARQKAKLECLRTVAVLEDQPPVPLAYPDFLRIEAPKAEERRRLLFDPAYCASLMETIFKSPASKVPVMDEPELEWEELALPHSVPPDCPLKFFRCWDNKFSPLYLEFVG